MKHIIIGTAGHVDHGKTRLTQALTGVDTDRLQEEKRRGITIEIGFAPLTLPNGMQASIVDVPGHEKLIHNMLTGASGIDVVLLIVAADDGVMPQTVEHLAILSSLGVSRGMVVITKTDLVEPDMVELVRQDVAEHVKGTFLEGAPVLAISAQTGEGIDDLRRAIARLLEATPQRSTDRPFRLPVDRVFSLKGFGTIVTGTVLDGTLAPGDEVMLYPQGVACRVREIQNHDVKLDRGEAGMRLAINLPDVEREAVGRGCTVAAPGSMLLSHWLTTRIWVDGDAPFPIKNNAQLHFYQGTQRTVCRVRLLEGAVLEPGRSAYAQLIFRGEAVNARNLDRFILRFFSPVVTIGGGIILDMAERKVKKQDSAALARLAALDGTARQRVEQLVGDAVLLREQELLLESGLASSQVHQALQELLRDGALVKIRGQYAHRENLSRRWQKCREVLEAHHSSEALMDGVDLARFRESCFAGLGKAADWLMEYYCQQGLLRLEGSTAALAQFRAVYTPEQDRLRQRFAAVLRQRHILPTEADALLAECPAQPTLARQVLAKMGKDGAVVALTPAVVVDSQAYREALAAFCRMFLTCDNVKLADYRTALGVNRKQAELYVNYFDSAHISRREGEGRVLLKRSLLQSLPGSGSVSEK